jgi:hypothetical protein
VIPPAAPPPDSAAVVEAEPPVPALTPVAARLVEAKPVSLRPADGPVPTGASFAERLAAGRTRAPAASVGTRRPTNGNRPPATANGLRTNGNGVRTNARRAQTNDSRGSAAKRGRPVEETRRLAAELALQYPDATHDDLAQQLGITTKRLKTVLSTAVA